MSENEKLLREIKDSMIRLQGIVGPIIPSALATLGGWTWQAEIRGERTILTRGAGPVNVFPQIKGERGWINSIGVAFSDPYSLMKFASDNWVFEASPYLANVMGNILPNNSYIYNTVYNPATPMGPLYSISWTPAQFWSYNSIIRFQARHPAIAPTETSQIVMAIVGRHYIRDDKEFYESIFVEGQRQATGRVEVPIRRNV